MAGSVFARAGDLASATYGIAQQGKCEAVRRLDLGEDTKGDVAYQASARRIDGLGRDGNTAPCQVCS